KCNGHTRLRRRNTAISTAKTCHSCRPPPALRVGAARRGPPGPERRGPGGAPRGTGRARRAPFDAVGRSTTGERMTEATERRLGFAVKVLGRGGLPSHDTRRWRSGPSVAVSIEALHRILGYLREQEIRMYRMTSDFVPYATHPDLPQFHAQIEEHAAGLADLGRRARQLDVRLSLHPSQYVVLNAEDDSIALKSMADLDSQARLLD